jgi:Tol biopolymer transport system component
MRRRAWLSFVAMGLLAATGQSQSTNSTAPKVAVILQGSSSFIVLVDDNGQQPRRLTTRPSGLEGEPALSRDGKLIAYSLAESPGGKSEVWIAPSTGGLGTRVSSPDQDALTPAFAQADRSLLYATSGFNGHYSPVARPRRHDFEINQIPISPTEPQQQ